MKSQKELPSQDGNSQIFQEFRMRKGHQTLNRNTIISFYEVGDRFPSPEVIIKLASIFHVSTDYLLGVSRGKVINVDDLTDEDIAAIENMVDILKNKNMAIVSKHP